MKISEAKFAGSSTRVSQKPKRALPEFAFIGRSNVGKSSLINALCDNRKLAMTSSTPGKTKLVNHFIINDSWYLVDLPGDGYAKINVDFISERGEHGIPFALIMTKWDKQGPNVLAGQIEKDRNILLEQWEELPPIFCSSAQTKKGKEEILQHIHEILEKLKTDN